jgi:hypothetical protein
MTHSPKGEAHNLEQNGVKDSAGFSTSLARGRESTTGVDRETVCAVVVGVLADAHSAKHSGQGIDGVAYCVAALGVYQHCTQHTATE